MEQEISPKIEIVNNIPIMHWDFPKQECGEVKATAKWAWSVLKNLTEIFCKLYCSLKTCKCPKEYEPIRFEGVEDWEKIQKDFHEALTYLPFSSIKGESCPACEVATAFAQFPLLRKYSPQPPVAILRMSDIEEYERVYLGGIQQKSYPCYIVKSLISMEGDFSIETYLREHALLAMDFDNFPPIPPQEADIIVKSLKKGQNISKKLWNLMEYGIEIGEEERESQFKTFLPTAITSAFALRDYFRIRHYYPDAITDEESKDIYHKLFDSLNSILPDFSPNFIHYDLARAGD